MPHTSVSPAQRAIPYAFTRSLELLSRKQLRGLVQDLQSQLDTTARPAMAELTPAQIDNNWRSLATQAFGTGAGPRDMLIDADDQPTTDEDAAVGWFDCQHGNTWLASSAQRYTHAAAADYIASLNAEAKLGHSDWRLPPIDELEPQRDLARFPAIRPGLNKLIKADYHWSSSPVPESADYARVVSFNDGDSDVNDRDYGFRVLACRGGLGAVGGVSPGQ